ncbi:MAG: helix-turn-helix transcriptional regulator [Vicinamibacterales bacterium]
MPTDVVNGSERQTIYETAAFRVTSAVFPPHLLLASHYHERACLSVVLRGGIEKGFVHSRFTVAQSHVSTMPPGARHWDRFSDNGAQMLVIEPDPAAGALLDPSNDLMDGIHYLDNPGLAPLAWRIARELRDPDSVTPLAVGGLALELLAGAVRHETRKTQTAPGWLPRVVDFLHASFDESFDIARIAAVAGVHPAHLARVFRAQTGLPLGAYVRRLRLDWAARELASSDASLCEIALRAGFADQSHFTRAFRQQTGLTPGRYREMVRQ